MILVAMLVLPVGCSKDYSVEPPIGPRVVTVSPSAGATSVNVTTGIQVDFSSAIDRGTVNSANLYFTDSIPGQYIVDGSTVRLVPNDSLEFGTTYTVVITPGIRGTNGEPLDKGKSWSFTTASKPQSVSPPYISGFSPAAAYAGATLTITGRDFWWLPGFTRVYISGHQAKVQSIDSLQIVCTIPDNVVTGPVSVTTPVGTDSAAEFLTIYQPGEIWARVTVPTEYSLSAVCWNGIRFVAVGNLGTIVTSEDGLDWTVRPSGTVNRLNAVVANGPTVVAVGTGGTVLTSPDGLNWTLQQSDTGMTLSGLARGSKWLAVGSTGLVLWSDNAIAWTPALPFTGQWLYGAAATTNGYVVVGHAGAIGVSNSLISWRPVTPVTSQHLLAVRQASTTTVAVGYNGTILTSTDLTHWTERVSGTTSHLGGIIFTGSRIVVVGDKGTVLTSPNGTAWQTRDSQTDLPLYDVAWSGRQLAAVGDSGCILLSPYIPGLEAIAPTESFSATAF